MADPYPAWAAWMRSRGYAATTVASHQRTVRRWRRSGLGAGEWLARVDEASRRRGGGLPTAAARGYRLALRAWFEFTGEPVPDLALPRAIRLAHPRPAAVLGADERALVAVVVAALPEPARTVLGLIGATGLRTAEACRARLDGIRVLPGGGLVLGVAAKGGGERTAPIPSAFAPHLVGYLRGARAGLPGPWLFPSPRGGGRPVAERTIRDACARVGAALGTRVHPHALRHAFATGLAEAGVDSALVAAALGHRQRGMTGRYLHPGPEAVSAAVERAVGARGRGA